MKPTTIKRIAVPFILLLIAFQVVHAVKIDYGRNVDQEWYWNLFSFVNNTYNNTKLGVEGWQDYTPRIRILDLGYYHGFCGFTFFSGVIFINDYEDCHGEEMITIIHELRHGYFFRVMPMKERLQYCQQNGFRGYNRACWEHYATKWMDLW